MDFSDGILVPWNDEKYFSGKLVGKGSYGSVFKAIDKINHKDVAIKCIPNVCESPDVAQKTVREILILNSFSHENIMPLLDIKFFGNCVYIVSDYCEYDLSVIIKSKRPIIERINCLSILNQILRGVQHMHYLDVLHRDIKPANILVGPRSTVKICDFGLARVTENVNEMVDEKCEKMTEYMVTRWYRAPEVVLNPGRYGKAQDVWAVACTFAELIRRRPLFPGSTVILQLGVILDVLGDLSAEDVDFHMNERARRYLMELKSKNEGLLYHLQEAHSIHPNLIDVMRGMLMFNPKRRITCDQAIQLDIFDPYRKFSDNLHGKRKARVQDIKHISAWPEKKSVLMKIVSREVDCIKKDLNERTRMKKDEEENDYFMDDIVELPDSIICKSPGIGFNASSLSFASCGGEGSGDSKPLKGNTSNNSLPPLPKKNSHRNLNGSVTGMTSLHQSSGTNNSDTSLISLSEPITIIVKNKHSNSSLVSHSSGKSDRSTNSALSVVSSVMSRVTDKSFSSDRRVFPKENDKDESEREEQKGNGSMEGDSGNYGKDSFIKKASVMFKPIVSVFQVAFRGKKRAVSPEPSTQRRSGFRAAPPQSSLSLENISRCQMRSPLTAHERSVMSPDDSSKSIAGHAGQADGEKLPPRTDMREIPPLVIKPTLNTPFTSNNKKSKAKSKSFNDLVSLVEEFVPSPKSVVTKQVSDDMLADKLNGHGRSPRTMVLPLKDSKVFTNGDKKETNSMCLEEAGSVMTSSRSMSGLSSKHKKHGSYSSLSSLGMTRQPWTPSKVASTTQEDVWSAAPRSFSEHDDFYRSMSSLDGEGILKSVSQSSDVPAYVLKPVRSIYVNSKNPYRNLEI